MNLGSHEWLAVGGNAGLLRILRVRNTVSDAFAAQCKNLLRSDGPG